MSVKDRKFTYCFDYRSLNRAVGIGGIRAGNLPRRDIGNAPQRKTNVKRLSLEWSATTDAPQGTVEATPLMHNGVLYGILPRDVMFAVDARTGKSKWRWDPDVPRDPSPVFAADPSIAEWRFTKSASMQACLMAAS